MLGANQSGHDYQHIWSSIKCSNNKLEYRRSHIGSKFDEWSSQMDAIICLSCTRFNFYCCVLSHKLRIVHETLHLGVTVMRMNLQDIYQEWELVLLGINLGLVFIWVKLELTN